MLDGRPAPRSLEDSTAAPALIENDASARPHAVPCAHAARLLQSSSLARLPTGRPCSAASRRIPDPTGGSIALCFGPLRSASWAPKGTPEPGPPYGTDLDHRAVPTRAPPPPATDPKRRRRSARASHSLTRIKGSHVSAVSRCLPLPLCLVSAGPINTAQDRSAG